jgi:predicted TIM-barrel fold metal-dependent hydrolase
VANINHPPIFDAHFHIGAGVDPYDLVVHGKNLIFNDVQSYKAHSGKYKLKNDSVSLIIDLGSNFQYVQQEAGAGRLQALKIHSRVQRIAQSDYDAVIDRLSVLPARLPIIIDAFYYGDQLDFQPSLPAIIRMLNVFSDRKFVIAHMGGYRILEYFFHLREFENCYYDLSFALQYFQDSSLMLDLRKLIKFTDKSRLMFGSDHPYASAQMQFNNLLAICKELSLTDEDITKILCNNALSLFNLQQ